MLPLIFTVTSPVRVKRINENINIISFGERKFGRTAKALPNVRVAF